MKLPSKKVWLRTAMISGGLFALILSGKDIAYANESAINSALGIRTSSIKGSGEDYFKTDYKGGEGLQNYVDSIGEEIEEEGLVLLKNDNKALPLSKGNKVSLMGQGSVKTNYSASGSSAASDVTYPLMKDVFEEKGLVINPTTDAFYTSGNGSKYGRDTYKNIQFIKETPWSEYDDVTKNSIASYGDAAIVTFCRDSGEGSDISAAGSDGIDGTYLSLSQEERDLLTNLKAMKDNGSIKNIIVLLNSAASIETDFLTDDAYGVDACLWIGNVGSKGLYGVADVLLGEVSPSGRLTDTYLKDNLSSPAMASWVSHSNGKFSQKYSNYKDYRSLTGTQNNYGVYSEGIYVGYRYYETRYEDKVLNGGDKDFVYEDVVAYPFGYGLSYASFEYSNFNVTEKDETFEVSIDVKNTSTAFSGKDVVEIYMQKPYISGGVEKASVELVGYAKTAKLDPNASETVKISVDKEEMKSYDADNAKTYICDKGDYYLAFGTSAHDALNNILAKKGKGVSDGMDAAGNASFAAVATTLNDTDLTTYSVSSETGKAITNQFDFMDMNKYENKGDNSVTYVSRADWSGTFPSGAVEFSLNDAMVSDLGSNKALPSSDGYDMPNYSVSNGLKLVDLMSTEDDVIAYDDPKWDKLLDQMSYEDQALLISGAGFGTTELTSVNKPATLDQDGPTGLVKTKTGTVMPSLGIWASSFNDELVQKVGDALAEDVRFAEYHILYAPGINIHRTPFGGRVNEYFSEDPFATGSIASAFVKGMQNKGVIPVIKHFAFNNEEDNRNGIAIWMNEQEAREINLKPFEMALKPSGGNCHAVMTSFNRAGTIWTSASSNLMMNVLRDEFGFDGYSLTDMASSNGASYMALDDGIANGTDLFLSSGGSTSALDAYRDSAYFANRMREACHRVLYVIANYSCAMNGLSSDSEVVSIIPWWKILIVTLIWVLGVVLVLSLGLYLFTVLYKTLKKEE